MGQFFLEFLQRISKISRARLRKDVASEGATAEARENDRGRDPPQTEIRSSWDAKNIVSILAKAMVEYKSKDLKDEPLLLKGTAWIAGFPINNHSIYLDEDGGGAPKDFIGPSIDAGFRIAKLSAPTKLMVSVDLALLLLTGDRALDLYFDGTESHKGLLGGRPYPVIWYKVGESILHKAELELVEHRPNRDRLLDYCEAYIADCDSTWLIRPYLIEDDDFKDMPAWHQQVLETNRKVDERNLLDESAPSLAGAGVSAGST